MTDILHTHRASDAERLEAYCNVHEMWGQSLSRATFLRRRLASMQHNRAVWYVGCEEGRVISSLGCYPLTFCVYGQTTLGMAIGAVHTVSDYRGRGLAPQLIRYAEQDQREQGVNLSLLFSDIRPSYYEQLGYHACPSWEAAIDTAVAIEAARRVLHDSPGYYFESTTPDAGRQTIIDLYKTYHGSRAISIIHDEAYGNYLNAKAAGDEFFLLRDRSGRKIAYVRLHANPERLLIRDFALHRDDAAAWQSLLAHIVSLAVERSIPLIGGWLPNLESLPTFITRKPRDEEITMLKSLDESLVIDDDTCNAAEYFVEIDHV